jgi:hypothetical protein
MNSGNDLNVRIGQAWSIPTRMKAIWKSHLPTELKDDFFLLRLYQSYCTDVKHGVVQMRLLTRNLMVLTLNYLDMLLMFNGQNT